jgi:hypothetical protein
MPVEDCGRGSSRYFLHPLITTIELIATTDIDTIARRGVAVGPRMAPKRDREKKKKGK